jgi:Protein of unknown function (DUF2846)
MRGQSERWVAFVLVSSLALVLVLAAQPALAGDKDDDKDESGNVTFTKDHPMGEVQEDKALVYVVRPTSMGMAIKSFFFCDDDILGINKGSSYFFAQVDPGKHVFWSKSENVDALELEVEAGRTYYLQQHVRMGAFKARTKLEVLGEGEGKAALDKCKKHGTMTERGREKGAEIVREHKADTQKDLERRAKKAEKEGNG